MGKELVTVPRLLGKRGLNSYLLLRLIFRLLKSLRHAVDIITNKLSGS